MGGEQLTPGTGHTPEPPAGGLTSSPQASRGLGTSAPAVPENSQPPRQGSRGGHRNPGFKDNPQTTSSVWPCPPGCPAPGAPQLTRSSKAEPPPRYSMMIHSFALWGGEVCQQVAAGSTGPNMRPAVLTQPRCPPEQVQPPVWPPHHTPAQTLQMGRARVQSPGKGSGPGGPAPGGAQTGHSRASSSLTPCHPQAALRTQPSLWPWRSSPEAQSIQCSPVGTPLLQTGPGERPSQAS